MGQVVIHAWGSMSPQPNGRKEELNHDGTRAECFAAARATLDSMEQELKDSLGDEYEEG